MAECFAALLKILGDDAIPLIAPFLTDENYELRDAAATTLGESRLAAAFALLRTRLDKEITVEGRRSLLFGMALSRRPESLDYLLAVIDEEPAPTAVHAVESLAMYKNDPAVTARIRAVVNERHDASVTAAFQKRFT